MESIKQIQKLRKEQEKEKHFDVRHHYPNNVLKCMISAIVMENVMYWPEGYNTLTYEKIMKLEPNERLAIAGSYLTKIMDRLSDDEKLK